MTCLSGVNEFLSNVQNSISHIAEQRIPKTTSHVTKTGWLCQNVDCILSIQANYKAYHRSQFPKNYIKYKQKRA